MKILLLDVNCKYSSTGKIVYDLYRRLNADGHEARIAYGRGDVIDEPRIYKFGVDWETKKHALLARITGKNGCYSPKSTANLIQYIKDFQPDLIHIHELHAYFVNITELLKFLKEQQIPVVWTFHCEYMYTGKCGFAYECQGYKSGCGNCPYLRQYVSSLAIDKTAQLLAEKKAAMDGLNLKAIVTPSKWLADKTKETYLYGNNIQVIHNGIDTDGIFYPRPKDDAIRSQFGIPADARLILAVAPNIMDVRKGGQMVVDLAETMPDTQFVLVGADETKRHSANVQLIARTKDQDELARWYSEADLFIICSKAENFPTTCIEALCCGTPVVGLDECGTKETAPEPYGTFVRVDIAGDADVKYAATLEALQKAISTQLGRGLTAEEIRNYAVANYDNAVMYRNYLEIYNK
ncbi:Glycosyltransferase involved in cell wall bisynthesis [Pseudobutyrivibrio ruminis]|uniref:Glycosyltransferase involved in cell wall bisynthesis n=1 Tax=Pseudobutyrivibrio ruminis TaxID=46206 RepID=A0A1H7H1E4_9FIRM|nr:glycosyltransferase [Pseudobutyrivibrio ruminis]SEK44243.1 Glycosyltransferase involved in cell wall bisynthesis [Pseudobutyrivibrio ruminis]